MCLECRCQKLSDAQRCQRIFVTSKVLIIVLNRYCCSFVTFLYITINFTFIRFDTSLKKISDRVKYPEELVLHKEVCSAIICCKHAITNPMCTCHDQRELSLFNGWSSLAFAMEDSHYIYITLSAINEQVQIEGILVSSRKIYEWGSLCIIHSDKPTMVLHQ